MARQGHASQKSRVLRLGRIPWSSRGFCVAKLGRKTSDLCDEFRNNQTETLARTPLSAESSFKWPLMTRLLGLPHEPDERRDVILIHRGLFHRCSSPAGQDTPRAGTGGIVPCMPMVACRIAVLPARRLAGTPLPGAGKLIRSHCFQPPTRACNSPRGSEASRPSLPLNTDWMHALALVVCASAFPWILAPGSDGGTRGV
jgi:hypothetical protein